MSTIPALVGVDGCPFDWDGETPPTTLSGGRIIIEKSQAYAYGFFRADGTLDHVLVLAKPHATIEEYLTGVIWVEVGEIWLEILRGYRRPDEGFNISINFGWLAGQRIDDPHGHGVPRPNDTSATGKGLKLLIERFNAFAEAVRVFALAHADEATREALLEMISKAISL